MKGVGKSFQIKGVEQIYLHVQAGMNIYPPQMLTRFGKRDCNRNGKQTTLRGCGEAYRNEA